MARRALGIAFSLAFCAALTVDARSAPAFHRPRAAESVVGGRGGLRPETTDFSHLTATCRARAAAKAAARRAAPRLLAAETPIPPRWDSRQQGWITPVKSQGAYGTCWAFATCAALETALIKADDTNDLASVDLSENHLATHRVGFAFGFDDGGNNQLAAALLTAWRDPLLESQDPYARPDSTCAEPPVRHVQNVAWLPARRTRDEGRWSVDARADNAAVEEVYKKGVMEFGALSVGYYHMANAFRSDVGAHYATRDTPAGGSGDGGHAVTLIGWDDDYPASNFPSSPPGNGAYLCKNSWGADSGTNGCLWISYYDEYFSYQTPAAYPRPDATNTYGRVYQHDFCGQVGTWNVYEDEADEARGGKTNWCANVFTAVATGRVDAVGFYAMADETAYELRVYADCALAPDSGTPAAVQTGVVARAGFVTVPLETPVPLTVRGARFAVALRLDAPGTDYPLPVCCDSIVQGVLECTNVAHAGESFLSPDGENWTDFQDFPGSTRTENFCIKAYTGFGTDGEAQPIVTARSPEEPALRVRADDTLVFSLAFRDDASASVVWEVDGQPAGAGAAFVYRPTDDDHGVHGVRAFVSSAADHETLTWTVTVYGRLYVDVLSSSEAADGSAARPFAFISDALAAAFDGDEILVAPGVYHESLEPRATVLVRSTAGPAETIVDVGGGLYGYICFDCYDAPAAALSGFTLLNGNSQYAGGTYYGILTNCVISGCCGNFGGGAFMSDLTLCVISNCTAYGNGGGAYCSVLDNCLVVGNAATQDGGGAYATDLYNATLAGNQAGRYGGGAVLAEGALAVNSLVAGNASARGARYSPDLKVYPGSEAWSTPSGLDARFADPPRGDWRLRLDSPAVDAGLNEFQTTQTDLDDRPRLSGAHVDAGCYERALAPPEGWAVPAVPPGATVQEEALGVSNAMRALGFSAACAGAVARLADYVALGEWAAARGVSSATAANAPAPLLSAALGADALLAFGPEGLVLTAFAPTDGGTGWRAALNVENVDAAKINAPLLSAAVEIRQAAVPDGDFSPCAAAQASASDDGTLELVFEPPAAAPAGFFRVLAR